MTLYADDTVAELAEFITHHNAKAKREFPRVGSADHPTPWDIRHRTINDRLYDWEAARLRDLADH